MASDRERIDALLEELSQVYAERAALQAKCNLLHDAATEWLVSQQGAVDLSEAKP